MPTWSEILKEVSDLQVAKDPHPFDVVRRKYLAELSTYTKRDTILYATRWTQPGIHGLEIETITEEDIEGLMEVVHGLTSQGLDIILHSPGGSAEATEAVVSYLRKEFSDIRIIIPHAAMSAATMWACSADQLIMGKHSFLGPIDPQMILPSENGAMAIPAQAILDQFEMAKTECKDPELLPAWIPMLKQYGPAILVQCNNAISLSQELVKQWLRTYMFVNRKYASRDALWVARALADHRRFKSHARHLDRNTVRNLKGSVGLDVVDLESDPRLQDLVLSVYHATMLVFSLTQVAKIIENQKGKAFIKIIQSQPVGSGSQGVILPSPPSH